MCYAKEAKGEVEREDPESKAISWYKRNKSINQNKVPETVASIFWVKSSFRAQERTKLGILKLPNAPAPVFRPSEKPNRPVVKVSAKIEVKVTRTGIIRLEAGETL